MRIVWNNLSKSIHPGGRRGALTVLFFHRVLSHADPALPDEPTSERFARMLGWIASQYRVLPLELAVGLMQSGNLPPAAAAITFDDGYKDNFTQAAPLLLQARLHATFFISPAFLDGGIMWNDRVTEAIKLSPLTSLQLPQLNLPHVLLGDQASRGRIAGQLLKTIKYLSSVGRDQAVEQVVEHCQVKLPDDLMMTSAEVHDLAKMGFGIGAHTSTHPILRALTQQAALEDITAGRDRLAEILGEAVRLFAYPNGRMGLDFDMTHRDLVRDSGFTAAFTTDPGVCTAQTDPWRLPRFTPWDRTETKFRLRLLANQLRTRGK